MSKKERAEFDAALLKAETFGALRWTSPVERDVRPPTGSMNYSEGWDFNEYSKKVWFGWSSAVAHGNGAAPNERADHRSGSQPSRALFSTKTKALAAMRHELELMAAADLLKVDKMIAEDLNGGSE